MARSKKKIEKMQGITLLEALIGIGLVALITLSIYLVLFKASNNMGDAKQRTGAVELGNERMELIRSLPYLKVGTTTGVSPHGPIPTVETVNKNGFKYIVDTDIRYKDDTFDGVAPADTIPTDYKQAQVTVTWYNSGVPKSVVFFSEFIPNGVESNVGGGTLSINTSDSLGQIVPNVNVHIQSITNNPAVDVETTTDATGNVTYPGTPAQLYRITLSKSGHETVRTYPNPPGSGFAPIDPDLNVVNGNLIMKTFIMDPSASLLIKSVNLADGSGIQGLSYDIQGGKKIGSSPDTYVFSETDLSDESGQIEKTDLSPGDYSILNLATLGNSQYYYIGSDTAQPINVPGGSSTQTSFIYAPKTVNSLVVKVIKQSDTTPIVGAQVHVTGTSFDQTVTTGEDGLVYFPQQTIEGQTITMNAEPYQISVTAEGFTTVSDSANVDQLVVKTEQMVVPE